MNQNQNRNYNETIETSGTNRRYDSGGPKSRLKRSSQTLGSKATVSVDKIMLFLMTFEKLKFKIQTRAT